MKKLANERWARPALLSVTVQDGIVDLWGIVEIRNREEGSPCSRSSLPRRARRQRQPDHSADIFRRMGLMGVEEEETAYPSPRATIHYIRSPVIPSAAPIGRAPSKANNAAPSSVQRNPGYSTRGSVSYWWNGGGDGSVHSSVVAPMPQGLAAATVFRQKAEQCRRETRSSQWPRYTSRSMRCSSNRQMRPDNPQFAAACRPSRGNVAGRKPD